MSENHRYIDRISAARLTVLIAASLYALIRLNGGGPEDATACSLFLSAFIGTRL